VPAEPGLILATYAEQVNELDDRWREVGAFIREQRRLAELSLRKLSEAAGVSNPYLSQIERGLRRPSAEILRQIAGALHLSAETLYVRAGILEEQPGEPDLVAEIRRDRHLDEEQKRALIHIYRSFRAAGAADPASGSETRAGAGASIGADPDVGAAEAHR
jgi:transcriptional regulator with XRE-family HTH domain